MKKALAMTLLLLFAFSLVAAVAETWTCPQCGGSSEGNFCPYCGAKKPEQGITCTGCGAVYSQDVEYTFCPNCGTALRGAAQSGMDLSGINAGDTLTFGHYEQDGNAGNGAEEIEWIVLANDGGRCVMMSKYGLDAVYYNTEEVDVTWETCTLRRWLNGDFLNAAFTAEERAMLETVTVTADPNPQFDTDPGNDTRDKVFLLSIDELDRYAVSDEVLMCAPTRTAVANGVCVMEDDYEIDDIGPDDDYENATCWWWLRSPGAYPCYAADVYYLGSVTIDCWGALVDNEGSVDGSGCYTGPGALRPVVVLGL